MKVLSNRIFHAVIISSMIIAVVAVAFSSIAFITPKYSLTIYHFNVQYNPGDPVATERIITDALYRLLEIYEKHPNWKFTLEIQGLAIEMMYANYTYVFNLLKTLVNRGQCELIVTHYSDQLWIAYPYLDLVKSIEISREILSRTGLKISNIAMFQEDQWAPGLVMLTDLGYEATLVSEDIPRWFGVTSDYPILEWNFLGKKLYLVIFGEGIHSKNGITWSWRWVQDGEIAVTQVYLNDFKYDPNMAKNHEQRMEFLEVMGWKFITVSEWIEIAKDNGLIGVLNKYLPATTWNNPTSYGPFRWLGDHRKYYEDDGYVRGLNSIVRGKVIAAEMIHEKYRNLLDNETRLKLDAKIELAWKYLLLAEVSDSTGWDPLENEVQYSIDYSNYAINLAEEIANFYMNLLNVNYIQVLTHNRTIIATNDTNSLIRIKEIGTTDLPVFIKANGTTISIESEKVELLGYQLIRVRITASPSDYMETYIEGDFESIRISPVLVENTTVLLNYSDYPHGFWMALSNGLIMTDNLTIIRNNSYRFIAFKWEGDKVSLVETLQEKTITYELFIATSLTPEEAVFVANLINVYPIVTFER